MKNNYLIKTGRALSSIMYNNEKMLATIGSNLTVWPMDNSEPVKLSDTIRYLTKMTISNDDSIIATKTTIKNIHVFSLEDYSLIGKYKAKREDGSNICFTPDKKYLIDGTWDGDICLIDLASRKNESIMNIPNSMVKRIYFDIISSTYYFLVGTKKAFEGHIIKWKYPFKDKVEIAEIAINSDWNNLAFFTYNKANEKFIAASYHNVYISNNGFEFDKILECKSIDSIEWSQNGDYFIIAFDDKIAVYEYPTFSEVINYDIPMVTFAATYYNDKYICIGSWKNGYCYLFDDFIKGL